MLPGVMGLRVVPGEELKRLALELAERVSRHGGDPLEALHGVPVNIGREEACRIAGSIGGLVDAYRPIEEGGVPSNAFLALDAVREVFGRLCKGGQVEEELVALALALLGLLAEGKTARAAALASILESRLRRHRV